MVRMLQRSFLILISCLILSSCGTTTSEIKTYPLAPGYVAIKKDVLEQHLQKVRKLKDELNNCYNSKK
jgi:ABC-type uncharacterized transport system auxiliary subunit